MVATVNNRMLEWLHFGPDPILPIILMVCIFTFMKNGMCPYVPITVNALTFYALDFDGSVLSVCVAMLTAAGGRG